MGGNRNARPIRFTFPTQSKRKVYSQYWRKVTQFRQLYFKFDFQLFWYQKTSIPCEFTGYLFHDVHEKQQQVRWDTSTELAAGGNGNNRWGWERNGNKTSLSLGAAIKMGMVNDEIAYFSLRWKTRNLVSTTTRMNRWELAGLRLKKDIPAHL